MPALALDHLVLTVRDLAATRRFYVEGLGMQWRTFANGREALHFGAQKLNLHLLEEAPEPRAAEPTPGSADLCFLVDEPLDRLAARLETLGFPRLLGPVERAGATSPISSIYVRDPDGNLVELSRPLAGHH